MASRTANSLGVLDYIVFAVLLIITVVTGLYHGLYKGGQNTTKKFILADRKVFSLPVALTILASFISPITLLGVPAEIYTYGAEYIPSVLQDFIMLPTVIFLFAPVFYGLDIMTSYQYLDRRYGYPMRCFGAFMFLCQTTFYTAIVMFTPALAIEAVTGFNLWILILLTGIVCTFYTTIGGLRAVIWTDAFMSIVMFSTIVVLIITGTNAAGGFTYVWEINKMANRTDMFQFPLDLTERFTFTNLMIGNYLTNLAVWGVSQTSVQRVLSARSLKDAQLSLAMNIPMLVGVLVICCLQGLVMYAYYYGPSPIDGTIRGPPNTTTPDQITVFFVSEQFGGIPGYQGLYISCLVAGSLSTISSNLNAMSAVTLIDVIRPIRVTIDKRKTSTERQDTTLTKVLVSVYGAVCIALAYVCVNLNTLVALFNTIFGAVGGPLLGSFTLGMLWPRANTYGVLIGSVTGFLMGIWCIIGSYVQAGRSDMFGLYKLSFQWYSFLTLSTTVILSLIMSEFFRRLDPDQNIKEIDPSLLSTFIRKKSSTKSALLDKEEMKERKNKTKIDNRIFKMKVSSSGEDEQTGTRL
ncbi:sodium-dependent multivitamin transporter-like isoform X1 [Apostichopus japonicus]|uniref:sodium-dependent multivitamin transporter-like isoform X1 n=1 Tax=Stichopus japonicus TaxID=307972 RepID=UPI003AB1340F